MFWLKYRRSGIIVPCSRLFQILFDGLLEVEVPEYFVAGIGMRKFLSVEGFAYIYFQLLLNLFYDLFHD